MPRKASGQPRQGSFTVSPWQRKVKRSTDHDSAQALGQNVDPAAARASKPGSISEPQEPGGCYSHDAAVRNALDMYTHGESAQTEVGTYPIQCGLAHIAIEPDGRLSG